MGQSFSETHGYTPKYYASPLRQYNPEQEGFKFSSSKDRLKGEVFTVIRTLQECMLNEQQLNSVFELNYTAQANPTEQHKQEFLTRYKLICQTIRDNYKQ